MAANKLNRIKATSEVNNQALLERCRKSNSQLLLDAFNAVSKEIPYTDFLKIGYLEYVLGWSKTESEQCEVLSFKNIGPFVKDYLGFMHFFSPYSFVDQASRLSVESVAEVCITLAEENVEYVDKDAHLFVHMIDWNSEAEGGEVKKDSVKIGDRLVGVVITRPRFYSDSIFPLRNRVESLMMTLCYLLFGNKDTVERDYAKSKAMQTYGRVLESLGGLLEEWYDSDVRKSGGFSV